MAEGKGMYACARTLADDQVDAEILHGRVENFLDRGLKAVDFVEEEDFLGFKRSEDGGEVALTLKEGASTGLDGNVQFVGNDLGEGGFSEAWRAIEQNVVEGFAAGAGGFDGNLDVFFDALLANVFVETLGRSEERRV